MYKIIILISIFGLLHGEEIRPSIELNALKLILPTNIDRDIETIQEGNRVIGCKNGKGQPTYTFKYMITMFTPKIYRDINNYIEEKNKADATNRMTCVIFDYYKEITKGKQSWISQSSLYPKENYKESFNKNEYDVVHAVYCEIENAGINIAIIQRFMKDDVRNRDINELLLKECLKSTKYRNQDFLVMPKFLKNQWGMVQTNR